MTSSAAATFANHRGVASTLWVMVTLAGCELAGVHLLLSLWWRIAAWVMSAISLGTVGWLVHWTASWKRLPHELGEGRLRLHTGSLRHLDLALSEIAGVSGGLSANLLNLRDTRNMVPLAYPNRVVELRAPLSDRRGTRRVAIRVDDPAAFDSALAGVGVPILPADPASSGTGS